MKRILSRLYCTKASRYKLPIDVVFEIDQLSNFLKPFFPSDFARRPRNLSDWKYYKGTEFRRFLLYDGFLIFRKFAYKEVYDNFLLFACAIRILVDPVLLKNYSTDAEKLLRMFVKHSSKIYGQTFVVYNVHHLIHLVADCLLHGNLEEFSAFKFESFLGYMKNLLHAPGNTLSQIVCRTMEKAIIPRLCYSVNTVSFEQRHEMGPTLNCQGEQYKKIRTCNKIFCVRSSDAYCLTKSNEIVEIVNIIKSNDGETYLIGRQLKEKSNLFLYPFPSSYINIFIVSALESIKIWRLDDVKQKVVLLPLPEKDGHGNWVDSKSVCFPMPHSENKIEL